MLWNPADINADNSVGDTIIGLFMTVLIGPKSFPSPVIRKSESLISASRRIGLSFGGNKLTTWLPSSTLSHERNV